MGAVGDLQAANSRRPDELGRDGAASVAPDDRVRRRVPRAAARQSPAARKAAARRAAADLEEGRPVVSIADSPDHLWQGEGSHHRRGSRTAMASPIRGSGDLAIPRRRRGQQGQASDGEFEDDESYSVVNPAIGFPSDTLGVPYSPGTTATANAVTSAASKFLMVRKNTHASSRVAPKAGAVPPAVVPPSTSLEVPGEKDPVLAGGDGGPDGEVPCPPLAVASPPPIRSEEAPPLLSAMTMSVGALVDESAFLSSADMGDTSIGGMVNQSAVEAAAEEAAVAVVVQDSPSEPAACQTQAESFVAPLE